MHFNGTKPSPQTPPLLKYKKCSARMEAIQLMQCIIMENTLIKLTLHDEKYCLNSLTYTLNEE